MTNEEILKKAIEKAERNGWQLPIDRDFIEISFSSFGYRIIFSHDFARSFWGEGQIEKVYQEQKKNPAFGGTLYYPYDEGAAIEYTGLSWKYHLQQMVLEEDPLRYLEQFLDKEDSGTTTA